MYARIKITLLSISNSGFAIIILLLCSPAAINAQGQGIASSIHASEVSVHCKESADKMAEFLPDGHKYTTYLVSRFAGLSETDAMALTYYSQYPDLDEDYEATPVAIKYIFVPWKWEWRSDIMQVLHSLHGGDLDAVRKRRLDIGEAIEVNLSGSHEHLWKAGLQIHALADAYSHTKRPFNSLDQEAYGGIFGHALHLHHPDQIARPEVFSKYLAYIDKLFDLLNRNQLGDKARLEDFSADIQSYACIGNCSEAQANAMSARIEEIATSEGSFSKFLYKCIETTSIPLTTSEVQAVIDSIKHGSN